MADAKRVLVVDDDPDFVQMIRTRLQADGYEVITAADGEEALKKVKLEKPDVMLLDVLMPKMGGLKVLQRIHRLNKRLPVYILTGFSNSERFGLANKYGAAGFIVKTSNLKREISNITHSLNLASKYRPKRGFTLVEVMIAVLLLVGGVAASTFMFGRGIGAATDTENVEQGVALAQEKMENLRGTAFASIANEAKAAVSGWTEFSRDVVVSQPAGTNTDFKQVVVTVYWQTTTGEVSTALTSYVANVLNN